MNNTHTARWPDYRSVWRWHFYAGLLCIPFVLWLSATGSIYLFRPQIEAWLEREYDRLQIDGPRPGPAAEVAAAQAALPGSMLKAYELPPGPQAASRVLLQLDGETWRAWVHPQTLQVLGLVQDEHRPMRRIFHLHGELLAGNAGSMIVELAACWCIVLLLSGVYLWWPRSARLAGTLYPRLRSGPRVLWRDLHAVTGTWIFVFALMLLLTGLPWTNFWGGNFKRVREFVAQHAITQDWPTGIERRADAGGEHAMHAHHADMAMAFDMSALDRLVPIVAARGLAPPVLIAPPREGTAWTVRSDAANRPLRETLKYDGTSGALLQRETFAQRPLLDRLIGTGVAAHEGQWFGLANQLLGVATALGLILVCVSAVVLWWRRRPLGVLGAPQALPAPRLAASFVAFVMLLAVLLPLFGASLLAVLLMEQLALRRVPRLARYLGLAAASIGTGAVDSA